MGQTQSGPDAPVDSALGPPPEAAARLPSSFRDPSGFVFRRAGVLLRQVNRVYAATFERLEASGLLAELVERGSLVAYERAPADWAASPGAACVLAPEPIPFISYPYEWCFGELRDAALLTLELALAALERDFSLKDASAYNVQFRDGRPVFIDTLSFEPYEEGRPWIAYGQFCRHFLAPLALAAATDPRLLGLLRNHLDGVPLDLAAKLLPARTKLRPGLAAHLHLHSRAQRADARPDQRAGAAPRLSKRALLALLESLRATVASLAWTPERTEWAGYAPAESYSERAAEAKRAAVETFLDAIGADQGERPRLAWDFGANSGEFSLLAARRGMTTIAWDADPGAVELAYRRAREGALPGVLPLQLDLANPSQGLGWRGAERESLFERGPADVVFALALVHHLAIGANVPLGELAAFFAQTGRWVVTEFVPKPDPQVQRLLRSRQDVFADYSEESFESAMSEPFARVARIPLPESERVMYLFRRR